VTAEAMLDRLQELVDAGNLDGLLDLFADDAVLIGTAGDGRDREGVRRYLTAVVALAGRLRWEWAAVIPFHATEDSIGWAAFGDVVVDEERWPIRMTGLAVRDDAVWRLRQFHGSIPTG
jgi:hypothetical protein